MPSISNIIRHGRIRNIAPRRIAAPSSSSRRSKHMTTQAAPSIQRSRHARIQHLRPRILSTGGTAPLPPARRKRSHHRIRARTSRILRPTKHPADRIRGRPRVPLPAGPRHTRHVPITTSDESAGSSSNGASTNESSPLTCADPIVGAPAKSAAVHAVPLEHCRMLTPAAGRHIPMQRIVRIDRHRPTFTRSNLRPFAAYPPRLSQPSHSRPAPPAASPHRSDAAQSSPPPPATLARHSNSENASHHRQSRASAADSLHPSTATLHHRSRYIAAAAPATPAPRLRVATALPARAQRIHSPHSSYSASTQPPASEQRYRSTVPAYNNVSVPAGLAASDKL